MNLHVGTSGFSYPAWKGAFYPAKLPAKQFLRFYGTQFPTVEINSTFRAAPKPAALEAWAAEVPPHFRFVLKAPQRITHIKRLKDVGEPLAEFLAAAGALKERLGPVFFQLPPNMKKDAARLADFLALLPAGCRAAFEFRHATWFDDETFALLKTHGAALCVADADDELDVPFVATADWGYLRLRRADYDDAALAAWAAGIRKQKWREAFVFFKHEDEANGPRLASRLRELASVPC